MEENKTLPFGLLNLTDGEYQLKGGLGNKVLQEFEVIDGKMYIRGHDKLKRYYGRYGIEEQK